jgi:DNA-binding transcriptional LysR family regulator
VGAPILRRQPGGRRPVELTDAGRLLLGHAEHLLARVGATRADLAALASGDAGTVAIITIQSVGTRILPGVLRRFRAEHPAASVEIIEARTVGVLLDAVEAGEADVGFASLPVPAQTFDVRLLGDDPFVLVTAVGREEARLADLHGRRVLCSRGCQQQDLVEQQLLAAGVVPLSVDLFDDNGMIQELVAAGEGVAVVPRLTVDTQDPRVSVQLVGELPARRLVTVVHRRRHLGPAARHFLRAAVAGPPLEAPL